MFNSVKVLPVNGEQRRQNRRFLAAVSARDWPTAAAIARAPIPVDASRVQRLDWELRRAWLAAAGDRDVTVCHGTE